MKTLFSDLMSLMALRCSAPWVASQWNSVLGQQLWLILESLGSIAVGEPT